MEDGSSDPKYCIFDEFAMPALADVAKDFLVGRNM